MPRDVYPDYIWPDSCNGPGVVMSGKTAGELVTGAQREDTQPKVYIEDVFMFRHRGREVRNFGHR